MVTGASSGLGWELCNDLAKYDCRIIAAARRTHNLKALCDKINNLDQTEVRNNTNVRAVAVQLDVSADGPTIEACVKKAWDIFGRIDVLINNAGITGPLKSPLDLPEEDWDQAFKTNVRGSWLVSKYVGLQMRVHNQGGSIINISSISGVNRCLQHGAVAYASSKASLDTMTKVMAMELGKHNIQVNSIAPGIFKSEITKEFFQKNWIKNVASKTIPLQEFVTTNPAVTSLVRYLIHSSSNYVTGNIFIVDGGCSLPGVPLYSSL
ncbi:uncharacterized protein [Rutidosis leptorrhynchoides]|uniref:uncharacterized protein n=1 Tax=Rutidosis leptorrhynchoides TaxID=125765 RepID=UPI003A98F728